MAVSFHQPSVYAMFDAMPVPLLTFSVSGLVTYANPAAKQHPGRPVESLSGHAVIKSLVAAATLGKLKLPYNAKVEVDDGLMLEGQFMSGPAGLDVAFVAQSADGPTTSIGAPQSTMKLKGIMALLRDELSPPIHLVQRELKQLGHQGSTELLAATSILQQRLMRLSDLVEVFGNEVLEINDRVELDTLLRQLSDELEQRASQLGVRFVFVDPEQTLPPVYGNVRLLTRALQECLENAMLHSRKEINTQQKIAVEIRYKFSGQHVLINIRNRGASQLEIGARDAITPFTRHQPSDVAPRLGLPLVQRIVGLHGGLMRMTPMNDETTQVLIELPTGAPLRSQDDLGISQAQRYAKDLAQLMSRRKKEQA